MSKLWLRKQTQSPFIVTAFYSREATDQANMPACIFGGCRGIFDLHQMGDLIRNTYKEPAGHQPNHRQAKKDQQDTFRIAPYRTQN